MEENYLFLSSGSNRTIFASFYFFMFNLLMFYNKIKKEDTYMVKVGLNIKNGSKVFKPTPGDVVIFDGKDWYVTTKSDIFREYEQKMDGKLAEIEEKLLEIEEYKRQISAQMVEMSDTIRQFVKLEGEN